MNTDLRIIATATRKIHEHLQDIKDNKSVCKYHTEILAQSLETQLSRYKKTTGVLLVSIEYNPSDDSPMMVTIHPKRPAPTVKHTFKPQRDIIVDILYPMDAFVGKYHGKPYKTYKQVEKKLKALLQAELGN